MLRTRRIGKTISAICDHGCDTMHLIKGNEKCLLIDAGWRCWQPPCIDSFTISSTLDRYEQPRPPRSHLPHSVAVVLQQLVSPPYEIQTGRPLGMSDPKSVFSVFQLR